MSENFWLGKKVLITGATGLVGSWIAKRLYEEGACVVALVRDWNPQSALISSGLIQRIQVINAEIASFGCLERAINKHEVDTVFHLAAQTIVGAAMRNPLETFESNIRGTYNLLEACRQHLCLIKRIVIASSDKAYGTSPTLPYLEEMPLAGKHPYDVSKSCADLLAQTYAHSFHLPLAIARCGNIYGGGDLNWSRIIPGTIRSLLEGKQPIIRSNGKMTRDYLFVQDVVEGYLKLAENMENKEVKGSAFNFGPTQPYTVLEIVHILGRLMERTDLKPIILNQVRAEIKDQYLLAEKAERVLNWKVQFSLEEGLKQTIAWYEIFLGKLNYAVC